MLALWTGQRQGDLLRLPWSGYDGSVIRLKQGKTGARVTVPVGAVESSARRHEEAWAIDPHEHARCTVDRQWFHRLMA
jgi:hypothetical protein